MSGWFFRQISSHQPFETPLWVTNLIQAASTLKQRWKALHRKRFMTLMAKQDISWRNSGALVIQELPLWNMACSTWTSWWLNPPIWSILYNQIGSFLWRIGVKIINIWNHRPVLGFLCFFPSFLAKWCLLNINHFFHAKTSWDTVSWGFCKFSHSSHLANSKFIVCSPCQLPQLPLRGWDYQKCQRRRPNVWSWIKAAFF